VLLREQQIYLALNIGYCKRYSKILGFDTSSGGKVNTKIIQVVYTDNDPIKTEKVLEAVNTIYQIYRANI